MADAQDPFVKDLEAFLQQFPDEFEMYYGVRPDKITKEVAAHCAMVFANNATMMAHQAAASCAV